LPAWQGYNCTLELPCVPIYNHLEHNEYCTIKTFTNLTPDDITNWKEFVGDNKEVCPGELLSS
jgi:hypothetical protein